MEHENAAPRPRGPGTWLTSAADELSGRTKGNKAALDVTYTAAPSFPRGSLLLRPRVATLGALATALAVGFLAGVLLTVFRRVDAA